MQIGFSLNMKDYWDCSHFWSKPLSKLISSGMTLFWAIIFPETPSHWAIFPLCGPTSPLETPIPIPDPYGAWQAA
jgi:hypothetical protein